ncbi:CpsB/CapC family capsule biosynthesis tyrosine phosphatase [Aestuariivirga litoralis]|uniref:CpsB/CapC family capsule biosynthesis tyrosine phosphatase n=1 Tax=Aestuariivirga litoralis TaxID=2650924 RepID=UPI0018C706F2|nr:capsular biosynthesis protein [Aestuariivirga litoralis]
MIDLHSHILPGIDDGAADLDASLAIARMAAADGIQVMAATPHFMPGVYDNSAADTRARVDSLQQVLNDAGIALHLVTGCDAHIRPDFPACLRGGSILTIHDSRYVLFEPPHISLPQRMEELLFNVTASGFVPVLTHPERLKWIEHHYEIMPRLVEQGVLMQVTAGSLTGRFGKRAQYWANRMLAEGLFHIVATDAHNVTSRPPLMAEAVRLLEQEVGVEEARNMAFTRPAMMLDNEAADQLPPILAPVKPAPKSFLRQLFSGRAS